MGRLQLNVPQIQRSTRQIPLSEIVSVEGENPLAQGLSAATGDISKAFEEKMKIRRAAQQTKILAKAGGIDIPEGTPDNALADPDTFVKIHGLVADKHKVAFENAAKTADLQLKAITLGQDQQMYDPAKGTMTTIPGVKNLKVIKDENGLPMIDTSGATPGSKNVKIVPREPGTGAGGAFKNEKQLRGEFMKESEPFIKSSDASSKALTLADRKDAIGDTTLAFALTRGALGGQGRVTQQEIQQFGPQLGGLSDKIRQGLLGLANGQKFDDETRAQIKSMVQQQYQADSVDQKTREDKYSNLATGYQLNPANVVSNLRPGSLRSIQPPEQKIRVRRKSDGKVGTIVPSDFDPNTYDKADQ